MESVKPYIKLRESTRMLSFGSNLWHHKGAVVWQCDYCDKDNKTTFANQSAAMDACKVKGMFTCAHCDKKVFFEASTIRIRD